MPGWRSRRGLRPRRSPITKDEVYIIVRGHGILFHDGKRDSFQAGDFLFVAAGIDHRFEDYSNDLAVWVLFYRPKGGEIPRTRR